MRSWLDNFKRLNGLNDNADLFGVTSNQPPKVAQKRLGKLLATTRTDLVLLNLGIRAPKQQRKAVLPIVPRIDRTRRNPRRAAR